MGNTIYSEIAGGPVVNSTGLYTNPPPEPTENTEVVEQESQNESPPADVSKGNNVSVTA